MSGVGNESCIPLIHNSKADQVACIARIMFSEVFGYTHLFYGGCYKWYRVEILQFGPSPLCFFSTKKKFVEKVTAGDTDGHM